ncbi:MAG: hypothetical protein K0S47_389 [Herbinix sp.]|jgi:hypothetical protein|nr:hypothetical protein [Herbinix sp.]
MKGLLLKDALTLKKQGKIILIMVVFYTIYSASTKNISMLGAMVTLLCAMMPITTLSYDEFCQWDKYALSMPVSRNDIVLSKYIFGVILDLLGVAVVTVISLVIVLVTKTIDVKETLITTVAIGGVALVFLSIILPLLFKLGVEKGRLMLMVVVFVPTMLAMIAPNLNLPMPSEQMIKYAIYASPIVVILILLLSMQISIRIYNKKEF